MKIIMTIIFFQFTLLSLLSLYALSINSATSIQLTTLEQQVFAPWPSAPFAPVIQPINPVNSTTTQQNCAWWDAFCAVGKLINPTSNGSSTANAIIGLENALIAIANVFIIIGGGITWFVEIIFTFFQKIVIFGNIFLILMQEPDLSSVPFLGPFIIVSIPFTILIYAITIIRGNPSGI